METIWQHVYAARTRSMSSSVIRELLKLTEQPDFISFAGGLPAPEVFPVEQVRAAADKVLTERGAQALQYSTTEGYRPLRELIASWMCTESRHHLPACGIDNILITSGSQQALDLIGRMFIDPGDRILVESPTYLGALQAWSAYGPQYVTVPSDEAGMVVDALEDALRTRPKFIYLVPNFNNPTGRTLSLQRRRQLVELAARHGVPIVEDDPYGQLRFEGEALPSLVSLAAHTSMANTAYHGSVIYLSSFSKILAPGFRLAWVCADPEVIVTLTRGKQGADLHTSTLSQNIAYEVAKDNFLDRHLEVIRQTYRTRRDVMLAAMQQHFPLDARWNRPEGGMFLWCELAPGVDATERLRAAVPKKVAFVPGASFYPCGGGENTMRLNFSNAAPDKIREGIARLGEVLAEQVAATG
ncbi:MAG: PLP-dependent aminotransferase family protein [Anaerolineae bacterium]|nr:PLP-dependent aminotransferase family protein [Thermoflexales bacterium]MDW8407452.1 PLP-dependent aminotransferase family protein [Anaerolineae bacterium]